MSVRTSTCVWVECDGEHCDRDKGWPDGEGPFHFDSEQAALDYVLGDEDGVGWTRMPDGRLLCRSCSTDVDCAVTGHQWTPWRPGAAPDGRDSGIEIRWCGHCGGGFEERLTEMGGA